MHISFLNDRGQRFLAVAPRIQEGREVAAFLSLGISRSTVPARLPGTLAVAVKVGDAGGRPRAVRGPGQACTSRSIMRLAT